MMTESYSRRQFLNYIVGGALALTTGCSMVSPLEALADGPTSTKTVKADNTKPKPLTKERVEQLMKKETVDDILADVYKSGTVQQVTYDILADVYKSGTVQQVTYDKKKRTTNYDQLVFQRDKKASERKPVMVLFYIDKDKAKNETTYNVSKREAIVFRQLAKLYNHQIDFIVLKESIDPKFSRELRARKTPYNIRAMPSIAMYSPWDVTKGETPKKHDGKVTQVDIIRGGPSNTKGTLVWSNKLGYLYIEPNLIKPNGKYVRRFQNSNKVKKISLVNKTASR